MVCAISQNGLRSKPKWFAQLAKWFAPLFRCNGRPWEMMCALVCALICAAGVEVCVAQNQISVCGNLAATGRVTSGVCARLRRGAGSWRVGDQRLLRRASPMGRQVAGGVGRERDGSWLLAVSSTIHSRPRASDGQMNLGQVYFPEKTGQVVRHGIWPPDPRSPRSRARAPRIPSAAAFQNSRDPHGHFLPKSGQVATWPTCKPLQ
jgi:hypothetical protein